ncbi:MAG: 50S ribosomal protein L9 [Leptospirales bacterium]|nr:50S ribosomal protein L9 [Leptospirales bacterium]
MKVILQRDVANLGDAGDVKEVSRGFARNYLLPRKLVVLAQAGSQRALDHQKKLIQQKNAKRHTEMQKVAQELQGVKSIEVSVRVGARNKMFGSVTTQQIAAALAEKGFAVDRRKVELSDKIRNLGAYTIRIRLAEKVIVPLQLQVVADANSPIEEEYVPPSAPVAAEEEAAEEKSEA